MRLTEKRVAGPVIQAAEVMDQAQLYPQNPLVPVVGLLLGPYAVPDVDTPGFGDESAASGAGSTATGCAPGPVMPYDRGSPEQAARAISKPTVRTMRIPGHCARTPAHVHWLAWRPGAGSDKARL